MADPPVVPPEAYEAAAAIEHQRWSQWQRWMHDQCIRNADGSLTIPAGLVERWERQIATSYAELSEAEKRADREQVDRYWPLAVAEGRRQATIEVDRSWTDAIELASGSEDFSAAASFAAGVAEGRRQASEAIRAAGRDIHQNAAWLYPDEAARIAEGTTDA